MRPTAEFLAFRASPRQVVLVTAVALILQSLVETFLRLVVRLGQLFVQALVVDVEKHVTAVSCFLRRDVDALVG